MTHGGSGSSLGTGRIPVKDNMLLPHQNQAILSQPRRQGAHPSVQSGAHGNHYPSASSKTSSQFLHTATGAIDLDERQWHLGQCAMLAANTTLHNNHHNGLLSTTQVPAYGSQ
ncbi:hypothetical protein DMENIID0001_068970 [Sergentomyia squamirostris]